MYFTDNEDELEDVFYSGVKDEIVKQAKKMNICLNIYNRQDGMNAIPRDLNAFIAVGWLNRKEIDKLYRICKRGVFIGTSPDEKLYDAVRPNMDSFMTQMVDYFMEKGHKSIGFIGEATAISIPVHHPWISGNGRFGRALLTMGA